jgi:hypothetical protein
MTSTKRRRANRKRRLVILAGVLISYAVGTFLAWRRGYTFGRNVAVRCNQGHLFTTTWIPGASLKAIRLGFWRLQWCPAGRHVALVHPVKNADLTEEERQSAAAHHDILVP